MVDQPSPATPVNRAAIMSAVAGFLTLLSFCTAVAPIPLTGWVCYPSAAVLGVVAVVTGITSLAQIRKSGQDGRPYALIGISIGGLSVLATLCATALGILFFPRIVAFLQQGIRTVEAFGHNIIQFFVSLKASLK